VSPLSERLESILDDLKTSISPTDARVLVQRIWSLNHLHLELMSTVSRQLSEAQEKEDLVPRFDTK